MLSRVADRLYWAGRYIERAENTARLVNVYSMLLLDMPRGVGVRHRQMVEIAGGDADFDARYRSDGEINVSRFMITDMENTSSLLSSLASARENVRTTRDSIPSAAWHAINELYLYGRRRLNAPNFRKNKHAVLREIIARCQRITGLLAGTMSHGPGYQFVRMGRNIERADMTSRLLDVGATTLISDDSEGERLSNRVWMNVLQALSAHQMYRQNVRLRVRRKNVVQFLLLDPDFPRSIAHALDQIAECSGRLPNSNRCRRATRRLQRSIEDADAMTLSGSALHQYIDELQVQLSGIHGVITETWFVIDSE